MLNTSADRKLSSNVWMLVLGLMAMISLFSSDIYLPALDKISEELSGATVVLSQMSITIALLGTSIGLIFVGPLSDRFGRRMPLIVGMSIFILANLLCIFAPNIWFLLIARFVCGISNATAQVTMMATIFDLYEGAEASKMTSKAMMIVGISPIIAPIVGSGIINASSWRYTFVLLAAMGGAMLALTLFIIPETNPQSRRQKISALQAAKLYCKVLTSRKFVSLIFATALSWGFLFEMVTNSPFIVKGEWGFDNTIYLVCYGAMAIFIIVGSSINVAFVKSQGVSKMLKLAYLALIGALAIGLIAGLTAGSLPILLEIVFCIGFGCSTIINSNITTLAIGEFPENAGTANAVVSIGQNAGGAIFSPVAGILAGGVFVALPLSIVAVGTALVFALVGYFLVRFLAKVK